MYGKLKDLDEYLQRKGFDTTPKKSQFQINEEMASILVTFMMAEIDVLRARIEELEGKING